MEKEKIEKLLAYTLATASPFFPNTANGAITDSQTVWIQESKGQQQSGPMMYYFPQINEDYQIMHSIEYQIDKESQIMQQRYQSIVKSFDSYSKCFPSEKQNYFNQMANELSKLDFKDNLFSYNDIDSSIDSVLKLSNGLTLSVSRFVDDDIESPMVFSIHRGKTLLVSDELSVEEIVSTINSVTV